MLVSIAIFMSVMVVAAGSLVTIIHEDQKAQAVKTVIDNVTVAIDSMARNIRQATAGSLQCFAGGVRTTGSACSATSTQSIQFGLNGNTLIYQFVSNPTSGMGNIQKICTTSGCGSLQNVTQSITAPTSTIAIKNLNFYLFGTGDTTKQPRVLIMVDGIAYTLGTSTEFTIQTTASMRARQ